MSFMFENLHVYRRAVELADRVMRLTASAPRAFGFLSQQLNRASLYIATNLAEGNGRSTIADRRHFFIIARGSVHECIPLLTVATRHGIIGESEHLALRRELQEIARMLSGLIAGLENRRRTPPVAQSRRSLGSAGGRRGTRQSDTPEGRGNDL